MKNHKVDWSDIRKIMRRSIEGRGVTANEQLRLLAALEADRARYAVEHKVVKEEVLESFRF